MAKVGQEHPARCQKNFGEMLEICPVFFDDFCVKRVVTFNFWSEIFRMGGSQHSFLNCCSSCFSKVYNFLIRNNQKTEEL